jgi:hypothetical protein
MKKKLFVGTFIFLIVGLIGFLFAYRGHRDIASEKADFELTVNQIQSAFNQNDSLSNKKYLDRTLVIYGKITNIDLLSNSIVIDEKLYATFKDKLPVNFKLQEIVRIKGRFIGYDDLLEEFKLDQVTLKN